MARKKGTGKLNLCSYKQSAKQKLGDIKETIEVDVVLQKHYEFILANFEAMQGKLDDEINLIQQQKDELLEQFIAAPERLTELAKHISEISTKAGGIKDQVTNRKQKEAKYKNLKEKLAQMEKQMAENGIDIPDVEAKIKAEVEEGDNNE